MGMYYSYYKLLLKQYRQLDTGCYPHCKSQKYGS
jgi:hypothetical protein